MKNNNMNKQDEGDVILKSALLKLLKDLDVVLPNNISTLETDTDNEQEDENIELEDFESKE